MIRKPGLLSLSLLLNWLYDLGLTIFFSGPQLFSYKMSAFLSKVNPYCQPFELVPRLCSVNYLTHTSIFIVSLSSGTFLSGYKPVQISLSFVILLLHHHGVNFHNPTVSPIPKLLAPLPCHQLSH